MSRGIKKPLIVFFFLVLGLFLPLRFALAQLDLLANLIAGAIWGLFATIILYLSSIALQVSSIILNWVLGKDFIAWSYTGFDNPLIAVGWTVLRDLTNMFFLIGLVFIGLATALRIEALSGYKAQRTLPTLIAIALLINFTPVICGIIVDASNIIMNFFLGQLTGVDLVVAQSEARNAVLKTALRGTMQPLAIIESIAQALVMVIFNTLASIIILLFAAIFAFRYLAIWILVILSPLAFFSYIFPSTRRFFNLWWHQFLQWCIIGINAAFFLYLGNHIIIQAPSLIQIPPPTAGILAASWIDILNTVMPFGLALTFLVIGFTSGLSTGAMGASAIVSFARRQTRRLQSFAQSKASSFAKEKAGQLARMPLKSEGVRKLAERMSTAKPLAWSWGEGETGIAGKVKRAISGGVSVATRGVTQPFWALGRKAAEIVPSTVETEVKEINEAVGKAKGASPVTNLREIRFAGTLEKKIGRLIGAAEDGQIGDLRELGLSDKEIEGLGQEAGKIRPDQLKRLARLFPLLSERMTEGLPEKTIERAGLKLSEEDRKKYGDLVTKLVAEATPQIIENWSKSDILSDEVKEAARKFWSGHEIGAAARKFGGVFVDTFMETVGERDVDWHLENNPKLLLYLSGTAAQDLGFRSPEGITREEVQQRIKEARRFAGISDEEISQQLTEIADRLDEIRALPAEEIAKHESEMNELARKRRELDEEAARRIRRREREEGQGGAPPAAPPPVISTSPPGVESITPQPRAGDENRPKRRPPGITPIS